MKSFINKRTEKKTVNDTGIEDVNIYPFNKKYPPDPDKYGTEFHGYKNDAHETFFYNFAVQGYDLAFRYKDKMYYALSEPDHVALCDDHFTQEYQTFKDGNDLLENWRINGHRLIDIIDECDDVEAM